jgi:glycosyl transferase family 87
MSQPWQRGMLALVVALAAAGFLLIASQSTAARQSSDFTINVSAGALVRQGDLPGPYDQARLGAMMRRVAPDGGIDPRLPFSLPLAATLPFVVLSFLPLDLGFRVWQLVSAALMLVALLILQRAVPLDGGTHRLDRRAIGWGLLGLLAAVPTWATLTEGQVTPALLLGAALVAAAWRWNQPALAAGAAMLLAIKPQYLPPYLIVLYGARQWRSLAAAGAGAAAVLLSPLAAGGAAGVLAMLHNALSANQVVALRLNETWVGLLAPTLSAATATALGVGLYASVMLGLLIVAWRRPASTLAFAAAAGCLGVLASPHGFPHDLLLLAIPAWLGFALARRGALPLPLAGLLLTDLALIADQAGLAAVPVGPIVMTAVLAWYGWAFRQRAARQGAPAAAQAA